MSKEGAPSEWISERLRLATEALDEEIAKWNELGMSPNGWRMADSEIMFLCQLNTIYELMKELLGITEDEFNAKLREVTVVQFQQLRKHVQEQKSDALLRKLTEGINFRPPPDLMNGGPR